MRMKKFSLVLGAVCLLSIGCTSKEVPVEAMGVIQTAESIADVEESVEQSSQRYAEDVPEAASQETSVAAGSLGT